MRRRSLLASVGGLLAAGVAGCTAIGNDSPAENPDGDGTTTTDPTTRDETPTGDPTTTTAENVSVEYVLDVGEIPDEIGSVEVTLRAVFVEKGTDFDRNRCWRDTYHGPYKPTITPIGTPAGECYRTETVTVELTEVEDGQLLGSFDAPGSFAAGHGLIVTDASAEYRDGSSVDALRGAGGKRVNLVEGRPDDRYRVEFEVGAYEDRPYRYWLLAGVNDSSERLASREDSDRTAPGPSVVGPRTPGQ